MTRSDGPRQWRPANVVSGWRTFWFSAQRAYPLGLIRIVFGVLVVIWTFTFLSDLHVLFGDQGLLPKQPSYPYHWGVFKVWSSDTALLTCWAVLLVAAIALTAGWHSRLAALVVFVLIVSFIGRNPFVWNSGDVIIRVLALFIAVSPCGAALSLDQRRREGSFWSAQVRPQWPIRLIQLQLALIYLSTAQAKMSGSTWLDGTAVSYVMRNEDYVLIAPPHRFTVDLLLVNAATWGTLAIEIALGLLVWNRRLRPWVLWAGVVMHLIIFINMAVGLFSPAILVMYLAWVPPDVIERIPESIRRRFGTAVRSAGSITTSSAEQAARDYVEAPNSEDAGQSNAMPVNESEGSERKRTPVNGKTPTVGESDQQIAAGQELGRQTLESP